MKSKKVFLVSVFLFIVLCKSSVSGIDPEALLPNYRSQHYKIIIDKAKPCIQCHKLLSATQACAKKCRPNHDVKQHAKNNPYLIDPNYTYNIIHKRGDSTHKLRINRAIIEKADEKLYQDQINAEGIYDPKQKENIEAIFQSLAYKTDYHMTNLYDHGNVKANMEAVFGFFTSELEQNRNSNRLNTVEKGFIDNSTLMGRIADIFGPPPTDFNNLHFKRNIDEKNYQDSLQAAIYNNFGPEVLKPDTSDEGGSITSPMEDADDAADNSGLSDRYPPLDAIVKKNNEDHKTSTATQDSRPAQSTPDSRQISRNRPDIGYPDSSGSGNWASPSPKTQQVPIPPPTSLSSIPSSSPSILSHDDVDDPPSSTSSVRTAPSRNSARVQKANLILLNYCLYCFCLMAALVSL